MNSWIMNVNSNGEEVEVNDTDESSHEIGQMIGKQQYLQLKKKLKLLLFENEFFQENLRLNQKRLLKVSKDRSFLLDRLLKYEAPESSTESEASETASEEDTQQSGGKKRKLDAGLPKKKKMMIKKQQNVVTTVNTSQVENDDVAMVERHLEARNSMVAMPSFTFNPQEIFEEVDDI